MVVAQYPWSGRLPETDFLARLYNLNEMPSYDYRYKNAAGDICQHRENNNDWPDDWIYTDARFHLLFAADDTFLRFLCEMMHPVVQPDPTKVTWLLDMLNSSLAADAWEIAHCGEISGKPIFAGRRLLAGVSFPANQAQRIADALSASYLSQQITRMQNALEKDPELAIGTAKEFLETICKTVLARRSVPMTGVEDMPQLVRLTLKQLKLTPDSVIDGSDTIRVLLGSLGTISHKLAELRNSHGSGHGKDAEAITLEVRHARLAVGAATSLAVFIFETHESEQPRS